MTGLLWPIEVAVRAAWLVLRQNRMRSLLTLAICGLGTAGVVVAGVLGGAGVAEMQARLRTLGGGLLIVSPNRWPPFPGRSRQLEHFVSLVAEDAEAAWTRIPGLQAVVPLAARSAVVRSGRVAARVRLVGVGASYFSLRGFSLAAGRFLLDGNRCERAIALGDAVARQLQPVRPGDTVALDSQPYTVVGVLRPAGVNFAGEDEDLQVFIPLDTYTQRVANRPSVQFLYAQVAPGAASGAIVRRLESLLRGRHGRFQDQGEDAIVRDLAEVAARQSSLLETAAWGVAATSGLLLAVGSVGIATLMLLVVRQRRMEIGLRRALGATPAGIGMQFFVEGVALAAVGILAGLTMGMAAAGLLTWELGAANPAPAVGHALWVTFVVSVGTCVIPAAAAARIEPADALRP